MNRLILISGFFSGETQKKKVDYFERLEEFLCPAGYRLLIVNLGQWPIRTTCDSMNVPGYIAENHHQGSRDYLKMEDLPPELIHAAAVEAEDRSTRLPGAGMRVLLYYAYMRQLLLDQQPAMCVMWHEFNMFHFALTHLCRRLGVPYRYIEYGVLPGTVNFDAEGQMAESWVARKYEHFRDLPVQPSDLQRGRELLELARENQLCRKTQPTGVSVAPLIEKARSKGRRVIFYGGQNDWASGMMPRWAPCAKIHSPHYESTLDGLAHLVEVACALDAQVLFKPHPMVEERHKEFRVVDPDRVNLVVGANIFECIDQCDLTATILSQLGYHAVIRHRPLLLMGTNHLYKKGCSYDLASRRLLESLTRKALERGFDEGMRDKLDRHVAQLCKYYLFGIDPDVAHLIKRDVDAAAQYLLREIADSHQPRPGSRGI